MTQDCIALARLRPDCFLGDTMDVEFATASGWRCTTADGVIGSSILVSKLSSLALSTIFEHVADYYYEQYSEDRFEIESANLVLKFNYCSGGGHFAEFFLAVLLHC